MVISWLLQVSQRDMHVYICDLGLAKLHNKMSVIATSKGSGAGTLAYKAPEMFVDCKRSTPVDIYSFGCVIIEMHQNERVWGDLDGYQIMGKVLGSFQAQPESPPVQNVSEQHRQICKDCTAYDPSKRPSASQLVNYFMTS